jgi:hypothetical protein
MAQARKAKGAKPPQRIRWEPEEWDRAREAAAHWAEAHRTEITVAAFVRMATRRLSDEVLGEAT